MAGNILTKDVKGTSFSPMEAGMIAVAKVVSEGALARVPFVGNGSLRSGLIKMVGAGLFGSMLGKNVIGKSLATGMMVDGGEDIVRGVLGGSLGLGNSTSSQSIGGNTANQGSGVGGAI